MVREQSEDLTTLGVMVRGSSIDITVYDSRGRAITQLSHFVPEPQS
jgi:hypothetical protein